MDRKPLVLGDDGLTQQLQGHDDLDVSLEQRHARLQARFDALLLFLLSIGLELPSEALE